ncbi:hypothetical protein FF1_009227 [Malus domestica]
MSPITIAPPPSSTVVTTFAVGQIQPVGIMTHLQLGSAARGPQTLARDVLPFMGFTTFVPSNLKILKALGQPSRGPVDPKASTLIPTVDDTFCNAAKGNPHTQVEAYRSAANVHSHLGSRANIFKRLELPRSIYSRLEEPLSYTQDPILKLAIVPP